MCYLRVDPIKSCLYLVLSLILISPVISLGIQIWYRYFVSLVFLRGIFVILVYFTRISSYNYYNFGFYILIFLGFFIIPAIYFLSDLQVFYLYFRDFFFLFIWIIFSLFFFINFTRYFLNFSGALRKTFYFFIF